MPERKKVVLIAGNASGTGRSCADVFARKGYRVLHALRSFDLPIDERDGASPEYMTVDGGADPSDISKAFQDIGQVDVLINDTVGDRAEFGVLDAAPRQWESALDRSLTSALRYCQAVIPRMIESGGGSLITLVEVGSHRPRWGDGPSCMAQAGLLHMTRSFAFELARHRITVNGIASGNRACPIDGEKQATLLGAPSRFRIGTPSGCLAASSDLAEVALFLSSPPAAHITGQCLYVDGGQSLC